MQKIKIASIEVKEGEKDGKPWKRFLITSDDKSLVSTFDSAASSLKAGDTIEAEIELKGKYANIKSFKVLAQSSLAEVVKPVGGGTARNESIDHAIAVKAIVELRVGNVLTDKSPEYQAVMAWCRQRLNIAEELWPEDKPEPSPQPTGQATSPIVPEKSTEVSGSKSKVKEIYDLVDLVWLQENQRKARFPDKTVISWLKSKANYQGLDFSGTLADVISRMNKEQADFLCKEIESRASMA